MSDEPRIATDYRVEDAEQVVSLCLTLATVLGDLTQQLCIVGGLVPSMICEAGVDPSALDDGAHVGTLDLDVALEVSVLDDAQYKEIAARLRTRGFQPDRNERGNEVRQRWRWGTAHVTVDFLIPPASDVDPDDVRVQSLEHDFAALVVMPLALVFEEPVERRLKGRTLLGDEVVRTVRRASMTAWSTTTASPTPTAPCATSSTPALRAGSNGVASPSPPAETPTAKRPVGASAGSGPPTPSPARRTFCGTTRRR